MAASIGTVWDRTVEVLRGRSGILASIAMVTVFLPAVVNNAVSTYVAPSGGAAAGLTMLIAFGVLVASIWGQLAMLAVATHPATTRADAGRQATARLLPAIGVVVVLGIVATLAFLPVVLAMMHAGIDLSRMAAGTTQAVPVTMAPGLSMFLLVWLVAFVVAAFWLGARLLLLNPVILNERRGLGAVRRSIALTRGMTWRLVGVMLLFVVVLLVASSAVQFVVVVPLRLLLGTEGLRTALFLGATIGAVVTTAFSVIAAAFTAQLYVATAGEPAVD